MMKGGNVTVMVSDVDRAVKFYTETLGLPLKARYGDAWAEVSVPGVTIGLHPRSRTATKAGGGLSIGFQVDNLHAAMAKLKRKGVRFAPQVSADGALRIAFFADPDENPLYLAETNEAEYP